MWSYQVCAIICVIFGIYACITNLFSDGLFSIKNAILKVKYFVNSI